jgi:hypothetical protein
VGVGASGDPGRGGRRADSRADTLDLRTYHIVDISAEPYDGDQTHSTSSVLRGNLTN